VGDSEAHNQHHHANAERPATNSEELSEVALKDARPIGKIPVESFGQILCSLILGVAFWEMDDNSDGLIGGQFTRPTDDKFLRFAVEVAFPERMGQLNWPRSEPRTPALRRVR
jgi:hypothetical protein